MNNDLNPSARLLKRGQLERIEDGRGSRVFCLSGCLWMTEQGNLRDIVLSAGEEAAISRNGTTIVMALGDARWLLAEATVVAPQPETPVRASKRMQVLSTHLRRALWLA